MPTRIMCPLLQRRRKAWTMALRFPARVPNHLDIVDYGANALKARAPGRGLWPAADSTLPGGPAAAAAGSAAAMRQYGRSLVFLGRLVLKFRRHSPQPPRDREIEGGSRHRDQHLGLATQICTTDH